MKERLTGAIVLVALLVLLVPELLTGPGHEAPHAQVDGGADGDGAQMRSYTINLADGAGKQAPGPGTSEQSSTPAPESTSVTDEPVGTATPEPEESGAVSAADKATEAKDAPSASSKQQSGAADAAPRAAEEPPAEATTPKPRRAAETSANARVATPAAPASRTEPAAGKGFVVQVGSFASRENAERLARELKGKGFASTVSQSTGPKRLWRVRVGPLPDRTAATATVAKLRAHGQSGAVVPVP